LNITTHSKEKVIDALYKHLDRPDEFKPSYINVTYHRSEHFLRKNPMAILKKYDMRKRPGTEIICAASMNNIT